MLKFSSAVNLAEFLEFLGEYMSFTEETIHQTILIGDMVEQAIRYTNIEAFERNEELDEKMRQMKAEEIENAEKKSAGGMLEEEGEKSAATGRAVADAQLTDHELKRSIRR